MFNTLRNLFRSFWLPAGAAKVSRKRVLITDVYEVTTAPATPGWYFNWYDEKHEQGELKGPFIQRVDAELVRRIFVETHPNDLIIKEGK